MPGSPPPPVKPALTPEQIQRITDLSTFAAKKQKVAQLLITEGLEEEAEPHREAAQNALEELMALKGGTDPQAGKSIWGSAFITKSLDWK